MNYKTTKSKYLTILENGYDIVLADYSPLQRSSNACQITNEFVLPNKL